MVYTSDAKYMWMDNSKEIEDTYTCMLYHDLKFPISQKMQHIVENWLKDPCARTNMNTTRQHAHLTHQENVAQISNVWKSWKLFEE